jgi:hypothetical protein
VPPGPVRRGNADGRSESLRQASVRLARPGSDICIAATNIGAPNAMRQISISSRSSEICRASISPFVRFRRPPIPFDMPTTVRFLARKLTTSVATHCSKRPAKTAGTTSQAIRARSDNRARFCPRPGHCRDYLGSYRRLSGVGFFRPNREPGRALLFRKPNTDPTAILFNKFDASGFECGNNRFLGFGPAAYVSLRRLEPLYCGDTHPAALR